MHEMRLASAIIDSVRDKFGCQPDARVIRIGLLLGELAGVDPASLRFCFDEIAAGGEFEGVKLAIEQAPRRNYCPVCDVTFPVSGFEFGCPSCYSTRTNPVGGDEVVVNWVDLEEEEASAARMVS